MHSNSRMKAVYVDETNIQSGVAFDNFKNQKPKSLTPIFHLSSLQETTGNKGNIEAEV